MEPNEQIEETPVANAFRIDSNNVVRRGTTVIGTRTSSGVGNRDLVIRFNSNVTPSIAQQLLRAVTFRTAGGLAGQRRLEFSLSDGDAISNVLSRNVNVS